MANIQADLAARVLSEVDCQKLWEHALEELKSGYGSIYTSSMDDVQSLVQFVKDDWKEYNQDAVKEALWRIAWPAISKVLVTGLAPWYRDVLKGEKSDEDFAVAPQELGEAGA